MSVIDSRGNAVETHTSGLPPIVSLSAKSATTAVPVVLDGLAVRTVAVLVVTTSDGVSAGAVQLQGSLDGANWYNLGSAVSTTAASTTSAPVIVSDSVARYVRAAITTTITGGTVTATVGLSG